MEGLTHARLRGATAAALAALVIVATMPTVAAAAPPDPPTLPTCLGQGTYSPPDAALVDPWQTVLDADGAVLEHRLTMRRDGIDFTIRRGRRGFAVPAAEGRLLVGERSASGTSLTMVDIRRACLLWERHLDDLAYEAVTPSGNGSLRLALHDPVSRFFEGQLVLDVEGGATVAMIDGVCSPSCDPTDGQVSPADFQPAGVARPVPTFPAGAWPRDTALPFGWLTGAWPPDWARSPITSAAADATGTSAARSPQFSYRSGATEYIRYSWSFPAFCRYGIACASRNMPSTWAVWLRPHGTDFSWGTLRWCQKDDGVGCFDMRRVVIHELGHVMGLDHPSSAGFNLEANETVMHALAPARPATGSSRHAFGRCDVATLQELYDVPDNRTAISTCNDVATELTLSASGTAVMPGETVRLRADLRVADLPTLGRLAGNVLNGRSVKLKFRRLGSEDAWTTLWMEPLASGESYALTIAPQASWEFQAAFPAPDAEGLRYSVSNIQNVRISK